MRAMKMHAGCRWSMEVDNMDINKTEKTVLRGYVRQMTYLAISQRFEECFKLSIQAFDDTDLSENSMSIISALLDGIDDYIETTTHINKFGGGKYGI